MFRALCADHQVKIVYTASGIITPVDGHPVHGTYLFLLLQDGELVI
jgi:methionine-rich copper-binding protein CopC